MVAKHAAHKSMYVVDQVEWQRAAGNLVPQKEVLCVPAAELSAHI